MKPRLPNEQNTALTKVEVVVIVAVVVLLGCLAFTALIKARHRSEAICCNCNLKQIGTAFRIWEEDHSNLFPMQISTNSGGVQEYLSIGETFRTFQVMSNELSTPIILVCPQDLRRHATNFSIGFSNTNVSYFVGLVTNDANYSMFLSGDRNIIGGTKQANGILEITTNQIIGWGTDLHNGMGNIALADGSVQATIPSNLNELFQQTGASTNRFAIP